MGANSSEYSPIIKSDVGVNTMAIICQIATYSKSRQLYTAEINLYGHGIESIVCACGLQVTLDRKEASYYSRRVVEVPLSCAACVVKFTINNSALKGQDTP